MKKMILSSLVIIGASTVLTASSSAWIYKESQTNSVITNVNTPIEEKNNSPIHLVVQNAQKFYTADKGIDSYKLRKKWKITYGVKIWISQTTIDKIDNNSGTVTNVIASVGAFAGIPGLAISALTLIFKGALWRMKSVSQGKGVIAKVNWASPLIEFLATIKAQ